MSAFTTNTTARPIFGTAFAPIASAFEAVIQYRQYRLTVRELSNLCPTELADLGLYHGSIKSVAKEAVYGA